MDYIPLPTSVWQMAQGVWYRTTRDKYGVRIHPGLPERSFVSPAFVCLSNPPHNSSTSPTSPDVSDISDISWRLPKSPEISRNLPKSPDSPPPKLRLPHPRSPAPSSARRRWRCSDSSAASSRGALARRLRRCSSSAASSGAQVSSATSGDALVRRLRRGPSSLTTSLADNTQAQARRWPSIATRPHTSGPRIPPVVPHLPPYALPLIPSL